jgi:gas vesicle protein
MANTRNDLNPVGAMVAGAIAGAGVAIAGAIALSDENNRKKVKKVIADIKDAGEKIKTDMKDEPVLTSERIEAKVEDAKDDISKNLEEKN